MPYRYNINIQSLRAGFFKRGGNITALVENNSYSRRDGKYRALSQDTPVTPCTHPPISTVFHHDSPQVPPVSTAICHNLPSPPNSTKFRLN